MPTVTLLDLPGLRARESAEPGFAAALVAVGEALNLDPNYIGAVMANESGFNPQAQNPHVDKNGESAIGLIQFMTAKAKLLGTTFQDAGVIRSVLRSALKITSSGSPGPN